MCGNTAAIIGIELLAACQGVSFHAPHLTSPALQAAIGTIRNVVPPYTEDRFFAPDIEAVTTLVEAGAFTLPELAL